mgnify:FL=1
MTDQISSILQYFTYKHLPEHLQEISKHFSEVAYLMVDKLPVNRETIKSLDKLLEAKDAAVRAYITNEK